MAMNRIVVVLGMHRSGTSVIARGLQVLGVDLGEKLIGGIAGNNEKDLWQDAEINDFKIYIVESVVGLSHVNSWPIG